MEDIDYSEEGIEERYRHATKAKCDLCETNLGAMFGGPLLLYFDDSLDDLDNTMLVLCGLCADLSASQWCCDLELEYS